MRKEIKLSIVAVVLGVAGVSFSLCGVYNGSKSHKPKPTPVPPTVPPAVSQTATPLPTSIGVPPTPTETPKLPSTGSGPLVFSLTNASNFAAHVAVCLNVPIPECKDLSGTDYNPGQSATITFQVGS